MLVVDEQDAPVVTNPLVKVDGAGRGILSEIGSSFDDAEDCFQVWCAFSRKAERFADTEEDDYRREWDSFSTDNRGGAVGTLVGMAQDSGNNKGGGEIQLLGVVKKGSAAAVPEEDDEDLLAGCRVCGNAGDRERSPEACAFRPLATSPVRVTSPGLKVRPLRDLPSPSIR